MNTNLLYCSVLDKKEMEYLYLFLITLKIYSKCYMFDILIMTTKELENEIPILAFMFNMQLKTMVPSAETGTSIFEYTNASQYEKFLCLRVDIIFQKDVSILFDLDLENKLYISTNNGAVLHKATNSLNMSVDTELLNKYIFMSESKYPLSPEENGEIIMNYFHGETNISKKNRLLYHLHHLIDKSSGVEPNDNVTFTQYTWGAGNISFENYSTIITTWGRGTYKCLSHMVYYITWSNTRHIAIFNKGYNIFTSVTIPEMNIQIHMINPALKTSIPFPSQKITNILTGNRKLIYFCAFHKKEYLFLLQYLLVSMKTFSKIDEDTDFLVFTSNEFKGIIDKMIDDFHIDIKIKIFDFKTQHEAGCARLHIFEYESINNYDKILYLDTDILIQRDLMQIFDCLKEDKLYATKEYDLYGAGHGGFFFDFTTYDKKQPSLNSGVLLFRNSPAIRAIFHDINTHIENLKQYNTIWPNCMDQPFISYHFISNSMCDLISLTPLICLSEQTPPPPRDTSQHIIIHFVWPLGNALHKMDRMKKYMNVLMEPK